MAKVTAQEFAEKWANRLGSSTADIERGVRRVQTAPSQKAIAAKAKLKQNWLAAVDNGKWEAGLSRVSLQDWQNQMINKGLNRIATGANQSKPKVQAFAQQLLTHIDAGVSQLEGMPNLTIQDSIARMTKFVMHMHNFERS